MNTGQVIMLMESLAMKILDDLTCEALPLLRMLKWYKNDEDVVKTILHLYTDGYIEIFNVTNNPAVKLNSWEVEEFARNFSLKLVHENYLTVLMGSATPKAIQRMS